MLRKLRNFCFTTKPSINNLVCDGKKCMNQEEMLYERP